MMHPAVIDALCRQYEKLLSLTLGFPVKVVVYDTREPKMNTCPTPHVVEALFFSVESTFGYTQEQIIGHDRFRHFVDIRSMCYHLLRKHTELSYVSIGREFSNRNHATIINGIEQHNCLYGINKSYTHGFDQLNQTFLNHITKNDNE